MAKKQKRQYSRNVEADGQTATATSTRTTNFAPSSVRAGSTMEFNPDYSYVVKDLKKIGIMAGSFIAILVALSFFLH